MCFDKRSKQVNTNLNVDHFCCYLTHLLSVYKWGTKLCNETDLQNIVSIVATHKWTPGQHVVFFGANLRWFLRSKNQVQTIYATKYNLDAP